MTMHELFAHLVHVMAKNRGRGLKSVSEECLEALHKLLRFIREKLARLTSLEENLGDTIFK